MGAVTSQEHLEMAGRINSWLAAYADVELLVKVGEYKQGSDPDADLAIAKHKQILAFLRQRTDEFDSFATTMEKLKALTR
jgi:ATP synthase in type III secretion protein N